MTLSDHKPLAAHAKRCRGHFCGYRVQGMSAFPFIRGRGGRRSTLCRLCRDREEAEATQADREKRARLRIRLSQIRNRLTYHRSRMAVLGQEHDDIASALGIGFPKANN